MMWTKHIKHIHFIGIGGVGMSGIAEVLLGMGVKVSGSDLRVNAHFNRLKHLGAVLFNTHRAANLKDAQAVVVSSAIPPENEEIQEARRRNIPVIARAEILGELMRRKEGIAIAGAHGKTTTSAMIGEILMGAGLDPTLVIGGKLKAIASNARLGQGNHFVAEADESDASFLKLHPIYTLVTNIDPEHMDHYGEEAHLHRAFVDFANRVPFYGKIIACIDDPKLSEITFCFDRPFISYGLSSSASIRGLHLHTEGLLSVFEVHREGERLGEIRLPLPGKHNILNALGAIAMSLELGVSWTDIQEALNHFHGVERRFDIKGEVEGILLLDDYAHHPTEIRATLTALRRAWADRRIVVLFQPHRYTRTRDFFDDFLNAFDEADLLLLAPLYAAGEQEIPGADAKTLVKGIIKAGHKAVFYVSNHLEIQTCLDRILEPGDLFITLGAGDIRQEGEAWRKRLLNSQKEVGAKHAESSEVKRR